MITAAATLVVAEGSLYRNEHEARRLPPNHPKVQALAFEEPSPTTGRYYKWKRTTSNKAWNGLQVYRHRPALNLQTRRVMGVTVPEKTTTTRLHVFNG